MKTNKSSPTGRTAGITLEDFIYAASCGNTFLIALYVLASLGKRAHRAMKRHGKTTPPPGTFLLGLTSILPGGKPGALLWLKTIQALGRLMWPALAGGGKASLLAEVLGGGPATSVKMRAPASFRPLAALVLVYMLLARLGLLPVPAATALQVAKLPPLFPVTPTSVAAWRTVADALLVQNYVSLSAIPLTCVQAVLNYSNYAPKAPLNRQTAAQYHARHNSVIRTKLRHAFDDICDRFGNEPMLQPAFAI